MLRQFNRCRRIFTLALISLTMLFLALTIHRNLNEGKIDSVRSWKEHVVDIIKSGDEQWKLLTNQGSQSANWELHEIKQTAPITPCVYPQITKSHIQTEQYRDKPFELDCPPKRLPNSTTDMPILFNLSETGLLTFIPQEKYPKFPIDNVTCFWRKLAGCVWPNYKKYCIYWIIGLSAQRPGPPGPINVIGPGAYSPSKNLAIQK